MRTFTHLFEPAVADTIGPVLNLTVAEIERAGINEVLQTPGSLSSWAIMDALLEPTGDNTPFVFREPLGHAREVKVALSGLFGRFVARAYLARRFGLSLFAHLGRSPIILDRRLRAQVTKRSRGDFPDWIACRSDLTGLTVAEAKGCHDQKGPEAALSRAWAQANRIDVTINGRRAPLKRVAIATRWGFANGGPDSPIMAVRDPDDVGDDVPAEEVDRTAVGIARLHSANLLVALGHQRIANALKALVHTPFPNLIEGRTQEAILALNAAAIRRLGRPFDEIELIGGVVTRAGPLMIELSSSDQQALQRLDFSPIFVGIERHFLEALIKGSPEIIRDVLSKRTRPSAPDIYVDETAEWIVRLGTEIDLK